MRYKSETDKYLDTFRYEFILFGIPLAFMNLYYNQESADFHALVDMIFPFSLYVNFLSLVALTLMTANMENYGVRLPAYFFLGLTIYRAITFFHALQHFGLDGDDLYALFAFMNMFTTVYCYFKAQRVGLHYSLPA